MEDTAMAKCETEHWELDCGEGHGCGLAEYSDTGELAGWFCSSDLVLGKPKPRNKQSTYIAATAKLEFCCTDMSRAALAEALDHFVAAELVVPKGKHSERVSHCAKGTIDEIIRGVGLSVR
jgi:hypothetical protein